MASGFFSWFATSGVPPDDDIVHDLKWLEATLQDGRAWLDGEEAQPVPVDPHTETMNKQIREWAYCVEEVLDEWKIEQLLSDVVEPPTPPPQSFGRRYAAHDPVADCLLDRDLRRKVYELKQRWQKLVEKFNRVLRLGRAPESRLQSDVPVERADGRDDHKEILVRFLLDRSVHEKIPFNVVAIVGAPAVGKTTLAKLVYRDPAVRRYFDLKAWVCASRGGRLVQRLMAAMVARRIAGEVPGDLFQSGTAALLREVLGREISGRRFLLVIDDASYDETIAGGQWEELSAALRGCEDGSVVVLTTHDNRVAEATATVEPYSLEPTPGDLSWSVFRKHVFPRPPVSPDNPPLFGVGKKMTWEAASARGGTFDDMLAVLKLSYDRLPAHLGRCFVYCSMFPRGFLFSREELVRLWMAQGFVPEEDGSRRRSLEDVAIEHFDDLWMMSFFRQSELDAGAFVLPNPLDALAQSISDGDCISMESVDLCELAGSDLLQKARHLSVTPSEGEVETDFLSTATRLRSLVVIPAWPLKDVTHISLPDAAFHSSNSLRVLDLRHTDLEALPKAVGNLIHLRYLNLSGTKITHLDASVFGRLYNLQTLDLSSTEIRELPDTIGNLRSLLLLGLRATMITELPESTGELSRLETLQLDSTKIEELPETIRGLKGLRFLFLDVGRIRRGLESVCWMYNLQALELQGYDDGESHNNVVSNDSDSEEQLYVQSDHQITHDRGTSCDTADTSANCSQSDHLLADRGSSSSSSASQTLPQLGQLPLLKTLLIDGMPLEHIGHEFCGSSDRIHGFPNLSKLCFKNMSKWKEWDGVAESDFPQLSELTVFNCPRLKGPVPCLHSPLTRLKVERCAVESIPTPASLEELDLIACDNLVTLASLSSLHSLTLMYCPKLGSLPSVSLMENLWIEECDQLTTSLSDGLSSLRLSLNTFAGEPFV